MNWLQEVNAWINSWDNDPERVRLLFVGLLAIIGFTITFALAFFLRAIFDPLKKRIGDAQGEDASKLAERPQFRLLRSMGTYLSPRAEQKNSAIRNRLDCAGYRSPQALSYFYGIKLMGFVLVPVTLVVAISLLTTWSLVDWLALIILSAVVAFMGPDLWLSWQIRRRQKYLRHALPDALDLLVVCAEAGLGLNAAIQRVADEIGVQHPELADEFQIMMLQILAGMDNRTALLELQRRTCLDDMRAFVTTLLQALRFGTSISESLKVFAEDMRDKRMQKAQEIAARLSLTMLMPIMLFMMPMFFLLALGPAVLSLLTTLSAVGSVPAGG